jgi:hypothetical protein
MRIGNKKIYHLEAWVVKVMSLCKVSVYQPLSCNPFIDWTWNKIAILFGHRAWRFRRSHLILLVGKVSLYYRMRPLYYPYTPLSNSQ